MRTKTIPRHATRRERGLTPAQLWLRPPDSPDRTEQCSEESRVLREEREGEDSEESRVLREKREGEDSQNMFTALLQTSSNYFQFTTNLRPPEGGG